MPLDTVPHWRLRRRETILAAAAALFAQRAYAEVQVDEVAKAAGIGKATLYRYFPSKEDLYLESLARALDALDMRLEVPASDGGTPRERLVAMVSALIDTLGEQLPTLKLVGDDRSDIAEQGRRLLRRRTARLAAAIRVVLDDGVADGEFRPHDTDLTPILIIGMVRGAIMQAGDLPRERLESSILDFVLAGTGTHTDTFTAEGAEALNEQGHRAGSRT